MKISYRTHPILKKIEENVLGTIPINELDKPFFDIKYKDFTDSWKATNILCKKNIVAVTKPFLEASEKSKKQLLSLFEEQINKSDFSIAGTYLLYDAVCTLYYNTKNNSEDNEIRMFLFSKEGQPLMFFIDSSYYKVYQNGWASQMFGMKGFNTDEAKQFIYSKVAGVCLIEIFKRFANVETKELNAGQKIKGIECNYKNDTKSNVTVLDSKWFTTLVKSDRFNVRGHFRLQPKKKDGEWTKELIWIDEFQKLGYTAHARMLSSNGAY